MKTGPFGLEMGMSMSEFNEPLDEIAPRKFYTKIVPKPHTAFESYVLTITPKHGLSWVKAIGKTIQTNPYGIEVQTEFSSMKSKLEKKYGKHDLMDFLMLDSIWNEPRDWMQGVCNGERVLMAQWAPKYGSVLGESLVSVALVVSASDTSSGYISIEYSFENTNEAELEFSALEDEAL